MLSFRSVPGVKVSTVSPALQAMLPATGTPPSLTENAPPVAAVSIASENVITTVVVTATSVVGDGVVMEAVGASVSRVQERRVRADSTPVESLTWYTA